MSDTRKLTPALSTPGRDLPRRAGEQRRTTISQSHALTHATWNTSYSKAETRSADSLINIRRYYTAEPSYGSRNQADPTWSWDA